MTNENLENKAKESKVCPARMMCPCPYEKTECTTMEYNKCKTYQSLEKKWGVSFFDYD